MKTISDHPLLIGQLLARAERREARRSRSWWRRLTGRTPRQIQTHIARFSASETVISHRI